MGNVMVGTFGWDQPEWRAAYYPPELPPEWRFCYFSNQIRAVIVPAALLASTDAASFSQWRDDSDSAFRFVLEVPPPFDADAWRALTIRIAPIRPQVAGCLLSLRSQNVTGDSLAALLTMAPTAELPFCVDATAAQLDDCVQVLRDYRIGRCWRPDSEPAPPLSRGLTLALMRGGDARAIAAALTQVQQLAGNDHDAGLFFLPSAATPQLAHDARVLSELMG